MPREAMGAASLQHSEQGCRTCKAGTIIRPIHSPKHCLDIQHAICMGDDDTDARYYLVLERHFTAAVLHEPSETDA